MGFTHNHTSFTVSDLDRSVTFYRDVLDFKLERTFESKSEGTARITGIPGAQLRIALMTLDGFLLELIQYLSPQGKKLDLRTCDVGATHICLCTDDIDAAYEELVAKGVKFRGEGPPLPSAPGRPRAAYFSDPDGIALELLEFPLSLK